MQLSVPWRRGQKKPFASLPRINWSHPLASGLVTFMYDGCGVVIDLVTGELAKIIVSGGTASIVGTQYGQTYFTANVGSGTYWGFNTSNSPIQNNLGTNYSFASGYVRRGATSANYGDIFCYCDSATTTPIWIGSNATTSEVMWTLDGVNIYTGTVVPALNMFSTSGGVVTSSTTGTTYHIDAVNGFNATNRTGLSVTNHTGFVPAMYIDIEHSGGIVDGGQQCAIFYGAVWKNRVLTNADWLNLHLDPWSLLIYPEDEIFATLVGVSTVTPFTWSQTGDDLNFLPRGHLIREMIRHD